MSYNNRPNGFARPAQPTGGHSAQLNAYANPQSAPQQAAPQQYAQEPQGAAPAKDSNFIQFSSVKYYDNRAEWGTEKWAIGFKFEEATALLAQLQNAITSGVEGGVVVNFTVGQKGNQKYPSGGFSVRGKLPRQNQPGGFVPRR